MKKTKSQQAQEYAEKKLKAFSEGTANDYDKLADYFDFFDVKDAFEDGYTACEQSMWRSVEDELPIGKLILCRDADRVALAYFDGEAITEAVFPNEDVTMPFWMPIPTLPETNTDKK